VEKVTRYRFGAVIPFVILHAAALAVLVWGPWTGAAFAWLAGSYFLRMFGVTAGYHRYFSHRSYRLGRVSQFLMAFLAQTSAQKGVLWWAGHHRTHHRTADQEGDIHSPVRSGFWWSHVGWVVSNQHDETAPGSMKDFARYPELVWISRNHWIPTVVFAAAILALGGWTAFIWGYVLGTVLLYHGTFSINSVAHVWGVRRFETDDDSRNNLLLALLTLGEGWHNNHHFSASSCRQGYRWWEVDITYYVLRILSGVGIARDLRPFRAVEPAEP
jgi:stearoyl-CoA desaturase (delta-9 desaturase)